MDLWLILEYIVKAIDFRTASLLARFTLTRCVSNDVISWQPLNAFKVHLTAKMNFVLFEKSLKMMKGGMKLFFYIDFRS